MRFFKYLTEGGGKFSYGSKNDEENHRTLESLIKSNNGIFKSTKQRWYLLEKAWSKIGSTHGLNWSALKHRGIKAKEGDYLVEVNAFMIFGKRGAGQGTRHLEWGYIVDDAGVREKYKYKFIYRKDGSSGGLDPNGTKQEWKRQETLAVKEFLELVAQENMNKNKKIQADNAELMKSDYVGVIGVRVKGVEVEVLRKHFFETRFGESSITVMKDINGNMIQHFGKNQLKKGEKAIIDFTVKGHEEAEINKWNKVPYKYTSVNRVKKVG